MKKYFVLFYLGVIIIEARGGNQDWYANCRKDEINCNYQIPGAKGDDCILHKLNVTTSSKGCQTQFTEQFPDVLVGSSDKFDVLSSFLNGSICIDTICKDYTRLNFTVHVGRGTRGVLFRISIGSKHFCRAIYLNDSFKAEKLSFWLWYDCMFFYPEEDASGFTLNIITYPSRQERTFVGKVVGPNAVASDRIEKWQTPILVETTSLENREVTIFFQEAYGNHNYYVFLRPDSSSGPVTVIGVNGSSRNEPVVRNATFQNLMIGKIYTAVVQLLDCQGQNQSHVKKCSESSSANFSISGHDEERQSWTTWIAIGCALVSLSILAFALLFMLRCYARNAVSKESPKVYILYSYDNNIHNNLVDAFATLLKTKRISVSTDKQKTTEDPSKWLRDHIFAKDVKIIIILSKGALYKASKNEPISLKGEPGNLTSHLFAAGLNFIRNKITNGHWYPCAYLGVVWDSSKLAAAGSVIPECKLFALNKKSWPKLLCEIYFGHRLSSCMNFIMPSLTDFGNDLEKCEEGRNFLDALKTMNKKGDFIRTSDASDSESGGSIAAEENVENPMPSVEPDTGYFSMNLSSMDSCGPSSHGEIMGRIGPELSVSAFPGHWVDNEPSAFEDPKHNQPDSIADRKFETNESDLEYLRALLEKR